MSMNHIRRQCTACRDNAAIATCSVLMTHQYADAMLLAGTQLSATPVSSIVTCPHMTVHAPDRLVGLCSPGNPPETAGICTPRRCRRAPRCTSG